jgi:hypothetical protein
MPYKGLESFLSKTDEQCVKDWILSLHSGSKSYVPYVLDFIEWGKAQKKKEEEEPNKRQKGKKEKKTKKTSDYWDSACGELLPRWKRLRKSKNEDAQNKFLSVIHDYVANKCDEHGKLTGAVDRQNCWAAICNFFRHNHKYNNIGKQPLPDLDSEDEDRLFRISEGDKLRAQFLGSMNVDEASFIIENAPMPYQAVFAVMLQAGFGGAEFQIFNETAWREIVNQPANLEEFPKELRSGSLAKVQIYRSKTSRRQARKYYTFLTEDAKKLIGDWLRIRPVCDLPHLFIVRQKGKRKSGEYAPVTTPLIENTMTALAKRLNLLTTQELQIHRYHITPHKLRKVFEGLCLTAGVDEWAVDFFLGHKPSRYNEVPWTTPKKMEEEYLRAVSALNIRSSPSRARSKQEMMRVAQTEFKKLLLSEKFPEREIAKIDLESKSVDEVRRMTRRRRRSATNGGHPIGARRQKVVPMKEVAKWVDNGWEFVEELSDKQVIIRSPPSA